MEDTSKKAVETKCENITCSFKIGRKINLEKLARMGLNVYMCKEKNRVLMKFSKPRVTATIWAKGQVACTDSKNVRDAIRNARYVAKMLKNLGFGPRRKINYEVVNVMEIIKLPYGIDLEKLQQAYPAITLSLEHQPSAIWKFKFEEFEATLKICYSGAVTIFAPNPKFVQIACGNFLNLTHDFYKTYLKNQL